MPTVVSDLIEVALFRIRQGRAELLLLRRAADEELYPGLWQIVTGSIHEGESGVAAARRELAEETGLSPIRFWTVPWVSSFYEPDRDLLHLSPFFAAEVLPDAGVTLSQEHDRYEWLPFPEAGKLLIWPGQRQGIEILRSFILSGGGSSRLTELPAS